MNLSQILQAIADFIFARLNALKAKILSVETTVTTLTQTVTTGLAARYTKGETDQVVDTAIQDATATITTAYQAADQIILAQSLAVARANVRKTWRKTITNGIPFGLGDAVPSVSGLENGSYQLFFDGPSTATTNVMLFDEAGVSYQQAVSNGDVYIFNVANGAVTDGIFVNDEDNTRFNLIQSQQDVQDGRLTALESGLNSVDLTPYATHAEVDQKVLDAFTELKNDLYGFTGYTDPN